MEGDLQTPQSYKEATNASSSPFFIFSFQYSAHNTRLIKTSLAVTYVCVLFDFSGLGGGEYEIF